MSILNMRGKHFIAVSVACLKNASDTMVGLVGNLWNLPASKMKHSL